MKRPLFWVCILLSCIALLHFWLGGERNVRKKWMQYLALDPPWEKETVCFSGRVCGTGIQGENEYFLISEISDLQGAAASRQIISFLRQMKTDRMQCFLAMDALRAMPKIGSMVTVQGQFSIFRTATNPGEFDYSNYYQGRQIGGALRDVVIVSESVDHSGAGELLRQIREHFGKRLDKVFPQREAGILRAMLLGDRSDLEGDLRDLYQKAGIIHILSISGLHVTLLGMGLYELLRKRGIRMELACGLAGTVLVIYGFMTGMSVSACRAIGMFLLRMLAVCWGRTYDLLTATAVLACAMLCLTPTHALNSGFWLSFGSIFGIGVVLPVLEGAGRERRAEPGGMRRMKRIFLEALRSIRRGFQAGVAVLLATLPLTLYFYFEVPTYAMLINLLVIPAMGPVIFIGFLVMLIPGLGILGTVDVLALRFFEWLCLGVKELPFSTWNPGCPKSWQIVAYYGALAAMLFVLWHGNKKNGAGEEVRNVKEVRKGKGRRLRRWVPWGLLASALLILAFPSRRMTGVAFLDIGQGDCVLIRLSNGQTWIYDCGSSNRNEIGENILIPFLKHEGIRRVEGIFVSHGDKDHVSGIAELLGQARQEGIKIDRIYLPERPKGTESFAGILAAADKAAVMVQDLSAGDVLRGKGISFLALHPEAAEQDAARSTEKGADRFYDENEASLCLYVEMERKGRNASLLLTGDVQGEGEAELLKELGAYDVRKVTVLKCAHHGSKSATSQEFLDQVDAEMTVISCGRKNSYGHPHAELLARLEADGTKILRTDRSGAIIINLSD